MTTLMCPKRQSQQEKANRTELPPAFINDTSDTPMNPISAALPAAAAPARGSGLLRPSSAFSNMLIFIAGTFVAFVFYDITHFGQLSSLLRRPSAQLQHLPHENYLQIRDDFAINAFLPDVGGGAYKNVFSDSAEVATASPAAPDIDTNIKEALGSIKLAKDMRLAGKDDKAKRLFEHAFALAPKHPEVLLRYGEYLEHNHANILLADQYYFQVRNFNCKLYKSAKV